LFSDEQWAFLFRSAADVDENPFHSSLYSLFEGPSMIGTPTTSGTPQLTFAEAMTLGHQHWHAGQA